ncbi:MAG: hypothetical protein ABI587_14075 [Gemmatimonadales bacterium]
MDGEKLLIAGMILAVMTLLGKVIIPIAQAYARRLDGGARPAQPVAEVAELEARVRELEARESRLAELEERMDFSERMLAQQRDPSRLGAGER